MDVLTEIFQYLRNWFVREKIFSSFTIVSGVLSRSDGTPLPLLDGQYFRIIGSALNDGVHRFGDDSDTLYDEPQFSGAVWAMAVPPALDKLADEIAAWMEKYGGVDSENMSPFSAESFGGYSYTKAQGYASAGGGMLNSWQSVFAMRLAPWRKI